MAYQVARTLADVEAALSRASDDLTIIAGGTDLMVRTRDRVKAGPALDVGRVSELRRVAVEDGELVLGAGVTYTDCLSDPVIHRTCPLLVRVAERFASPPIRNLATLGGNVANASPAGDGVAGLWALDARVEAITPDGRRRLGIEEVVLGPGRLGLPARSVLAAFRVPAAVAGDGAAFYKLVNRAWPEHPLAISIASVAVRLRLGGHGRLSLARIVLGAVAPRPVRATAAEDRLVGQVPTPTLVAEAAAAVQEAARPISDIRASADYRRDVLPALAATAIEQALRAVRGMDVRPPGGGVQGGSGWDSSGAGGGVRPPGGGVQGGSGWDSPPAWKSRG